MNVVNSCNSQNFNIFGTFQARVPIITINESMSGIQVDMSLKSADEKLKLFKEYLKIDSRVIPYLKAIKTWAKKRNICHSISGTINSFGYSCIGIAILQTLEPPILPNLQWKGTILSGDDFKNFGEKNELDLGELLKLFFEKMSKFNHKDLRISILHGGFVDKEKKLFNHETVFCIEDPLEPYLNFSRHVTYETLEVIISEFERASKILKNGGIFEDIL
jgi:DNA polymerase sigma